MKQEKLNTIGARLALLLIALFSALGGSAAESNFYQQFTNVLSHSEPGRLSDASLVDTNNAGPNLTNGPISFATFRNIGEIAGVRLGMTMAEVVATWGKPAILYSRCRIGPCFNYGPPLSGGITLYFIKDRLAAIFVEPPLARMLAFENGLGGKSTKPDYEKLLGTPYLEKPKAEKLYGGDVAFLTNEIRLDLSFARAPVPLADNQPGPLHWVSVRLEPMPEDKPQRAGAESK